MPLATAVDLFTSCAAAWFAARIWSGEVRWIIPACLLAGITAGFRESGVMLVLPLLAAALARIIWLSGDRLHAWKTVIAGVAAGLASRLCWLVPAAGLNGGLSNWYSMANVQMLGSLRKTSVFFGAPPAMHARMVLDVLCFFGIALSVLIPLSLATRPSPRNFTAWCSPAFLSLWLIPNLIVVFLLHCGKPGYILLSLPPLVLVAALRRDFGRVALLGVAAGILVSCIPYERLFASDPGTIGYLLLRSSPRFAYLVEDGQRELRRRLDSMPGSPGERLMISDIHRPEAPNFRTITFDFRDQAWTANLQTPLASGVRTVVVLCGGLAPSPLLLERFPNLQRVFSEAGFSLWIAPV